jgi:precorrin-2 dehydrogenase/sirohydrochlorin ferrochelatase
MSANPGFQVSLDLKGRPCLVLGGDDEAADKVERLLDAGAKVTVISATLNEPLRKLTAAAKILHRGRTFRTTDAQGITLVINTHKGDLEFAKMLYELSLKERFVLCSVDHPHESTAMLPAIVRQGHLRMAISTSGVAPALASRLRQDLEPVFDQTFQAYLDWLGKLREETQKSEPDAEKRRESLKQAVDGFKLTAKLEYPKAWQEQKR